MRWLEEEAAKFSGSTVSISEAFSQSDIQSSKTIPAAASHGVVLQECLMAVHPFSGGDPSPFYSFRVPPAIT